MLLYILSCLYTQWQALSGEWWEEPWQTTTLLLVLQSEVLLLVVAGTRALYIR